VWRGPQTSNYMQLTRVQWGRSSRTDKGVSSLALVISLRLLCPPGAFPNEADEEGEKGGGVFDPAAPMLVSQLLTDQINARLPPEVRGTSPSLPLPPSLSLPHLVTPSARAAVSLRLDAACGRFQEGETALGHLGRL